MKPNNSIYADIRKLNRQSFSESALRNHTRVFYLDNQEADLSDDEKPLWKSFLAVREISANYGNEHIKDEEEYLLSNLHPTSQADFKSPTNFIVTSSEPETKFVQHAFQNSSLFNSILKSPDKGFYAFSYSYKPETTAKTHTKSENFNPDFFMTVAGKKEVLVVEIKADGDDSNKKSQDPRRKKAFCRIEPEDTGDWFNLDISFLFLEP